MGDYNAIHKVEHRLIGSNVQEAELKDFKSFLIENNMSVLRAMGREFSWTNGHTYTMIDWALVNVSWMFDMPTSEVILLDPGYSDHSPLSLSFPKDDTSKAKPFKFINHLAQHENFQEIVMRAWNQRHRGGKMYDVWQKLKNVKVAMKVLNISSYQGVDLKIRIYKQQLRDI
ncbi:hypothetical protein P3L10_004278 [Capsicum annuum]